MLILHLNNNNLHAVYLLFLVIVICLFNFSRVCVCFFLLCCVVSTSIFSLFCARAPWMVAIIILSAKCQHSRTHSSWCCCSQVSAHIIRLIQFGKSIRILECVAYAWRALRANMQMIVVTGIKMNNFIKRCFRSPKSTEDLSCCADAKHSRCVV